MWFFYIFLNRFVNFEDKEWFDGAIKRVCGSEIGTDWVEKLDMEPYFVDFLRDAPEPTGDEPDDFEIEEPKVYEHVRVLFRSYITTLGV